MGPFPAPGDGVEEAKIQWQEMADATVNPSNPQRTNKQTNPTTVPGDPAQAVWTAASWWISAHSPSHKALHMPFLWKRESQNGPPSHSGK